MSAKVQIPAPTVGRIVLYGEFKFPRPALVLDVDPRIEDLIKIAVFGGAAEAPPEQRWARYGLGAAFCWWWSPRSDRFIEIEARP